MFDIDHELYLLTFRPNDLTIGKTMVVSFKIFWNILLLSLILSSPVIIGFSICHFLDSLS